MELHCHGTGRNVNIYYWVENLWCNVWLIRIRAHLSQTNSCRIRQHLWENFKTIPDLVRRRQLNRSTERLLALSSDHFSFVLVRVCDNLYTSLGYVLFPISRCPHVYLLASCNSPNIFHPKAFCIYIYLV